MHNLIEESGTDSYLLPKVLSSIGKESDSAERVRKHRAIKDKEKKMLQCNEQVTNCNTEIEKEIEKELELEDKKSNVTVTLSNATEIDIDIEKEKEIEKEKDIDIDYKSILKIWNGTNLPKLKLLPQKRKEKIKLRTKEVGLDNFLKSIEILNNSKFCLGDNKNNWKADLDWLIVNDTNIVKVLEGKYNDKNNAISKQQSDKESEEKYGF
jgi:hypothetical protein